jgi:hypothetical protein
MSVEAPPRMSAFKLVLTWIGVTLIAFPLSGYLGWGIAGHVDSVGAALMGGALTGAGLRNGPSSDVTSPLAPRGSWRRASLSPSA